MQTPDHPITVTDVTQGERLSIAGGRYRIIVSGEQTNGAYAVIEMNVPPGAGPIPHEHPGMVETFYVAEGEVEFRTAQGKYPAKKGAYINIPLGGGIHAFRNTSEHEAKLICTVMPAGLDAMFREVSMAVSKEEAKAIGERYGNTFYPPDVLG